MKKNEVAPAACAVIFGLCSVTTACRQSKDTNHPKKWVERGEPTLSRSFEPRTTGPTTWQPCRRYLEAGHVVTEAQCGRSHLPDAGVSSAAGDCEEVTGEHTLALRTLADRPVCTDVVIGALERVASTNPTAWSDVAAGYYVRAQRDDRPSDVLRALQAANHALQTVPNLSAAKFNRAVALEELGLDDDAIAAFDAIRRVDHSGWGVEAGSRRDALETRHARAAAMEWALNRRRIDDAVRSNDDAAVDQLVAPFPSAARRYVEEEALPRWADTLDPEELRRAKAIGQALFRLNGDPYLTEIVAAVSRARRTPGSLKAIREAHWAFRAARLAERAGKQEAQALYGRAVRRLSAAGSPLADGAELGRAVAVSFKSLDQALSLLDPLERRAHRRHYHQLLARIHSTRAFCLLFASRFVESLVEYDRALAQFTKLSDGESLANVHTRKAGVLRTAGQNELAWREASLARRYASQVVELQDRHHLLGENASCALALGFPEIAIGYQNAAVKLIKDEMAKIPADQEDRILELRKNLAIVVRGLAGIEVSLKRYDRAALDVEEAIRLANNQSDENVRRALLARMQEVNGQSSLQQKDAATAIASFTEALESTSPGEFRTFRASLFAERAAALRLAKRDEEAKRDLRLAVDELQAEEAVMLRQRALGKGEELWNSYFSRFQETYEHLIRQLVDEHHPVEAFAYAEKARAFELLNLVLRPGTSPDAFRRLSANGQALTLGTIQSALPRGTFIVQYRVMADRTYAWIVSHDACELVTELIGRADIDRWSKALQEAAVQRNAKAFEGGLYAPYDALVLPALKRIEGMPDGKGPARRFVFVPDASIHGLPLAALRDLHTGQYLIQVAPVSIAASSTLYVYSFIRDREMDKRGARSALLMGDPAIDERLEVARGLGPIPRARREVERIREIYAPAAEVRVGKEATVSRFLEQARKNAVVHIAGHAIVNAQMPFHSLLILAPSGQYMGALDATDLLVRLHADKTRLFVLSACSSAGGLPVGPEGVAPLIRPLIAAGVPGVIGSLWTVNDNTAEDLLVAFHRHYRGGSDAATALRLAQLDLIQDKNPGLRSALTWAPFQVIGYASSPFSPTIRQGAIR